MVQYMIVRCTKEEIMVVDGEDMAKAFAKYLADRDFDESAWYTYEPYAVL